MKNSKKSQLLYSRKQAFQVAAITSILLNAVLIMGVFYGRSRSLIGEIELQWSAYAKFFIYNFGCNLFLYYLILRYTYYISDKKKKKKRSRTIWLVAGIWIIYAILSPALSQLQWYALGGSPGLGQNGFIMFNLIKDIIAVVILLMITYNMYINYKREQALLANQRLTEENILARFEALKNQLDPHFLFNSLNTLNGLIGVDDNRAHDYVDNLSSVFRYTLHSKKLSRLSQEIEFVEAYVALLKIRYGDNLLVSYKIDSSYQDYYIMPVSIQMLVENAVKHNVVSNRIPLCITIETTPESSIVVSNLIAPKNEKMIGGVGLANLSNRYEILFNKQINIKNHERIFSVEVPLIKEAENITI